MAPVSVVDAVDGGIQIEPLRSSKGIAERFSELRLEVLQPEYNQNVLLRSLREHPVSFSE